MEARDICNGSALLAQPSPTKPSVSFEMLPDELLMAIIEEIDEDADVALHALCLVNRRFHSIAFPYLWGLYSFKSERVNVHRSFIEALVSSTSLENNLTFGIQCDQKDVKCEPFRDYDQVMRKFRELDLVNTPHSQPWAKLLEKGNRDAYLALMICLLPRISQIYLDFDDIYLEPPWSSTVCQALDPVLNVCLGKSFGQIQRFDHLCWIEFMVGSTELSRLSPLFRLPSLEFLCLASSDNTWQDWNRAVELEGSQIDNWQCPPGSSPVKGLVVGGTVPAGVLSSTYCLSRYPFVIKWCPIPDV